MTSDNYVIALQVRNGSSRLPGKMTRDFYRGRTIPELIIRRLAARFPASRIVLTTSTAADDAMLERLAIKCNIRCHRGSEHDVLGRVAEAVREGSAAWVVRVCGDNPFSPGGPHSRIDRVMRTAPM